MAETLPGGRYKISGKWVNADGQTLPNSPAVHPPTNPSSSAPAEPGDSAVQPTRPKGKRS